LHTRVSEWGDRFRVLDEVLGIKVFEEGIDHADRQGEPLGGPLRAAARVRIDGLECQSGSRS